MKDNQAKYPQLRFKGFTDPWEERKLGDAVNISSGVTGDATLQDGKYRLTRIESISQGMLNVSKLGFTNEKPDQKYLLNLGDILYSNINSLSHIGKVALVDMTGIYHGINLLRFQMRNGVDSEFLFQRLNTMTMKNWAVSHANPAVSQASINQTELSKQPISSPTLTEQQQIGNFFKEIDNTIALHQRKLAKLKELKQGYLQKMFPQNGSKFPQLRFSGFADAWEERKLADVVSISAGGDVDKTKLIEDGGYPVLANALTNSGIVGYYDSYKVEAPAVTVTGRGDVGHAVARHVNFTPVVRLLSLKSEVLDADFLANMLNQTNILVESTGVPQLTAPQLGSYKILYPNLNEQTKIGKLLNAFDNLIALHQRKLDKLQELKKGYLQKMFC